MISIHKPATATLKKTDKIRAFNLVFDRRTLIKGGLWTLLISIGSVAAVFFFNHSEDTYRAISHIKLSYFLPCLLMIFADLMLGSLRNHIFIRHLYPGISHWVSFKANVANMFMGAVTPFHSGAGPGQLYVYNRHGVKVLDGFVVSLINMGATLVFMPMAGLLAIWIMQDQLAGGLVPVLLKYGFSVFAVFMGFFVLAFFKPAWVAAVIRRLAALLGFLLPSKKEKFAKKADLSGDNISKYQGICSSLLQKRPLLFPLSLLITTCLYLNKYAMQYVILLGLGLHPDLSQVIGIQVLIQFMIYFAPSPGGSGFAEASIAVLFVRLVPHAILPVFTLLQRSFLLFIPAIIGACVILNLLKKQATD